MLEGRGHSVGSHLLPCPLEMFWREMRAAWIHQPSHCCDQSSLGRKVYFSPRAKITVHYGVEGSMVAGERWNLRVDRKWKRGRL